ncbi:MAG: hypothetical protein N2442_07440 [Spirochaetes bacterium]|nr:hypothetical protein [Spirochaetota bacterium]
MRTGRREKPIPLLGIACGILSICLLVQYGLLHLSMKNRPIHTPFLSYWGLEPLERIVFEQKRITLFKKRTEWFLEAEGTLYRPDPKKIDRFLTVLNSVRITLRDEATPRTMGWYGFKEEGSLWITFVSKGNAQRFLVGGMGPMGSEEYCVVEGKPFIYKLSDSISYYALKKTEYWIGEE